MKSGSCFCDEVTCERDGKPEPAVACHCRRCRETSGHFWSATEIHHSRLRVTRDVGPRRYKSSGRARRGFCATRATCGSSLFREGFGNDRLAVAAGAIDGKTGLRTAEHIHVADKGDYHETGDGLTRKDTM